MTSSQRTPDLAISLKRRFKLLLILGVALSVVGCAGVNNRADSSTLSYEQHMAEAEREDHLANAHSATGYAAMVDEGRGASSYYVHASVVDMHRANAAAHRQAAEALQNESDDSSGSN